MGKATGFMEFNRKNCNRENPLSRVNHWNEFEVPLTEEERRGQDVWIVEFHFVNLV